MTSAIDVERVVKVLGRWASFATAALPRPQYQPFPLHCSCGATVEMTGKKETCRNCGETVEVRRCVATPHGEKYILRVGKHRQHWNTEPLRWPLGLQPARPPRARRGNLTQSPITANSFAARSTFHARRRERHHHAGPEYELFTLLLSLLLLLGGIVVSTCISNLETSREWLALNSGLSPDQITVEPEPTDCGLFSGCHYESSVSYVTGKQGEGIIVEWHRVAD